MKIVTQLSQYLVILCGTAFAISGCVGLELGGRPPPFLTCKPVTKNARGDIDPVPSPNGRYVAYRSMTTESPTFGELHYLNLNHSSDSQVLLRAGEFHGGASWSPDSEWISYSVFERLDTRSRIVVNSIYKINVHTKQSVRLVDGRRYPDIGEYTSWTDNNEIVFATREAFYAIDAGGGTPVKKLNVAMSPNGELQHLAAGPGGDSIVFSRDTSDISEVAIRSLSGIWLAGIKSGGLRQLTSDAQDIFPSWQDAETILFLREVPSPKKYSLQALSISTGEVVPLEHHEIVYSIAQSSGQEVLFAATASEWDLSHNDLNFFRRFSISKCEVNVTSSQKVHTD